MGPKRIVVAGIVLVVAIAWSASAARAGGALLETTEDSYAPGDHVTAWTSVAWEHNADLGTPADGPFEAYLLPLDAAGLPLGGYGPWPGVPDDALHVGQLTVSLEPHSPGDGFSYGPQSAFLRFDLPEVPDGRYEIVHCNDPCTTTLGDITSGYLEVAGSDVPPLTEVSWHETVTGLRVAERYAQVEPTAKVLPAEDDRFAGGAPPAERTALPGLVVVVFLAVTAGGAWLAVRTHRRSLD